jgi:hydrogenase maturation protease
MWAQILVIGYGNSLRRDDGAGIALAEKFATHLEASGFPARLLTTMQLLPEMSAEIADRDIEAVIFVDTSAYNSSQDTSDDSTKSTCVQIEIAEVNLDSASPSTGHQLDPATLLVYAAMLYGHYPRAWIVTIPGRDFDHGEGFSPQVSQLLDTSAATANALLALIKEAIPCMN